MAIALLVLSATAHAATTTVGLSFTEVVHEGPMGLSGDLHGLRVRSPGNGTFTGFAEQLRVVTWNYTSRPVLGYAVDPRPGGRDHDLTQAHIGSAGAMDEVDVLIIPLQDTLPPGVVADGSRLAMTAASGSLDEVAYVDANRPTLHRTLEDSLAIAIEPGVVRVQGDFQVSVWGWDLRAGDQEVQTGSHRSNVTRDPATGREITADVVEQVAHLTVRGGWMEFRGVPLATLYADGVHVEATGTTTLRGLSGTLNAKGAPEVAGSTLVLLGASEVEAARAASGGFVDILHSDRASLDGEPVRILDQAPGGPKPGTTVHLPTDRDGIAVLPASAGVAALMLVLAVAHGPMQGFRFTRLQRSFEDRDYLKVLARIDPFTRRRRFQRRATFLKAVSLLSVEAFREAALYLETVDARIGPDPATTAFLRACAMAGQGHDALAIEHLTACFRIDPSYRDEARNVPALADLLPYFELAKA